MWRALGALARHGLLIALVVLVLLAMGVWSDLRDVQHLVRQQQATIEKVLGRIAQMTTYQTTWTSGGQPYSVSTTCREGETTEQCVQRFEDAVTALKSIHPPDR